ncbi:MAG TPA: PEGA domain-containing protein, partial [Candidatus Saccharimonadales bacterium]|nr:PEGA domain-containing protein [Candidatus Saccharimonadales bacterium]
APRLVVPPAPRDTSRAPARPPAPPPREFGGLQVHSAPAGAAVWLRRAGQPVFSPTDGITGCSLDSLEPGTWEVRLEKPGYRPGETAVVIRAGHQAAVSMRLALSRGPGQPMAGAAEHPPAGSSKARGAEPQPVKAGTATAQPPAPPAAAASAAAPGAPKEAAPEEPGFVVVMLYPKGTVFLDNQQQGPESDWFRIQVRPGRHSVRVEYEGSSHAFPEQHVGSGKTVKLKWDFLAP